MRYSSLVRTLVASGRLNRFQREVMCHNHGLGRRKIHLLDDVAALMGATRAEVNRAAEAARKLLSVASVVGEAWKYKGEFDNHILARVDRARPR